MKKMNLALAGFFLLACFTACSDSGTSTTKTDSPTTAQSGDTSHNNANNPAVDNGSTSNTSTTNATPFGKEDSTFAVKAAIGGLMEVEAGNLAQQNATNDRVKAFATMMVNDHSKANSELMSLASSRGMTLPSTLPPDKQKHMDAMRKMTGKAFDKHYMDMMVNDHKKTITDFEKEANGGTDNDLKGWAAKTLPTLQKHRDSAVAINKIKM